jgi:hypothetical protein
LRLEGELGSQDLDRRRICRFEELRLNGFGTVLCAWVSLAALNFLSILAKSTSPAAFIGCCCPILESVAKLNGAGLVTFVARSDVEEDDVIGINGFDCGGGGTIVLALEAVVVLEARRWAVASWAC